MASIQKKNQFSLHFVCIWRRKINFYDHFEVIFLNLSFLRGRNPVSIQQQKYSKQNATNRLCRRKSLYFIVENIFECTFSIAYCCCSSFSSVYSVKNLLRSNVNYLLVFEQSHFIQNHLNKKCFHADAICWCIAKALSYRLIWKLFRLDEKL